MLYIVVDTTWIAVFPKCVADYKTILVHHFVCISGWWLSIVWSEWEFYVSTAIFVEFNTWLLILKRFYPDDSFFKRLLKLLDHVSWFGLRLMIFPFIWYNAWKVYFYMVRTFPQGGLGGYWNTGLFGAVSSTMIMIQNISWTYDKYRKKWGIRKVVDERMYKLHDMFNLVCLPIVCALYVWHIHSLFTALPDPEPVAGVILSPRAMVPEGNDSWNYLWWTFWWYITLDTAWVIMYPESVPSPTDIVVHHIICLVGWHIVLCWPPWEFYISAGLIVEFNTWLLIAKRQYKETASPQWLNMLENVSWFFARLIFFPIVTWNFLCMYIHMCKLYPKYQLGFINTGLHAFITCAAVMRLNFKWTYKKWFNKKAEHEKGL